MKQFLKTLTSITLGISLTLTVSISQVLDGDSMVIHLPSGDEAYLRLACIDAMEYTQDGGAEAIDHMDSLVSPGDTLEVEQLSVDHFHRIIGTAKTQNGTDLGLEMVAQGHAVPYYFFLNECPNSEAILAAEQEAKDNDRGIWGSGTKYFPWVFRRARCLESAV